MQWCSSEIYAPRRRPRRCDRRANWWTSDFGRGGIICWIGVIELRQPASSDNRRSAPCTTSTTQVSSAQPCRQRHRAWKTDALTHAVIRKLQSRATTLAQKAASADRCIVIGATFPPSRAESNQLGAKHQPGVCLRDYRKSGRLTPEQGSPGRAVASTWARPFQRQTRPVRAVTRAGNSRLGDTSNRQTAPAAIFEYRPEPSKAPAWAIAWQLLRRDGEHPGRPDEFTCLSPASLAFSAAQRGTSAGGAAESQAGGESESCAHSAWSCVMADRNLSVMASSRPAYTKLASRATDRACDGHATEAEAGGRVVWKTLAEPAASRVVIHALDPEPRVRDLSG